MSSSPVKYVQNKFSTKMKPQSASLIMAASLNSMSIEIQIALRKMTPMVVDPKSGCLAILGKNPSLLMISLGISNSSAALFRIASLASSALKCESLGLSKCTRKREFINVQMNVNVSKFRNRNEPHWHAPFYTH